VICREPAAIEAAIPLAAGTRQRWDGRFVVQLEGATDRLVLRALGADGWRARRALSATGDGGAVPVAVGHGLPSLWRQGQLLAVPHLGLVQADHADLQTRLRIQFRPARPLAGAPFCVAEPADDDLGFASAGR
jgi:hypothetical protein